MGAVVAAVSPAVIVPKMLKLMYDHLDRLEQTIGRPITQLKAPLTAEQYFYEYTARLDAKLVTDRGLSWPSHACRWCTGRLKTHVINKHLRLLRRKYQLEQYVGIAADKSIAARICTTRLWSGV